MKKILIIVIVGLLNFLVRTSLLGTNGNDDDGAQRDAKSAERKSAAYRILKSKGGAFFRAQKEVNYREIQGKNKRIVEYVALDANEVPFEIEGHKVYVEWKGNSNGAILAARPKIFSKLLANYIYIGFGSADQVGKGIRFAVKIGDFEQTFSLENEEIPLRSLVQINGTTYALSMRFHVKRDSWVAFSNKGEPEAIDDANGYLVEIEYIIYLPADGVEDFQKGESLRLLKEVQKQQRIVKEKIESAEEILRTDAKVYSDYQRVLRQITEAREKIEKAVKLARTSASAIQDNVEVQEIILELQRSKVKIFEYLKKAQQEVKNKEIQIIEEIKQAETVVHSKLAEIRKALDYLEEGLKNDTRNLDEVFKQADIIRNGDRDLYKAAFMIVEKAREISHNTNAKKIAEEVKEFVKTSFTYFEKGKDIFNKIYDRIEQLSILEANRRAEEARRKRESEEKRKTKGKRKNKTSSGSKIRKEKKSKKSKSSKTRKHSYKHTKVKKTEKAKKTKKDKKSSKKKVHKSRPKN